jgi:nitroreductase
MNMENKVYELIGKRRSIRKFLPKTIAKDALNRMVDAARLAPSAANMQPLEYIIVDQKEQREKIFPLTKWAGYISPEGTPAPGEEPMAYIAVVINQQIAKAGYYLIDCGLAVENLILTALQDGIGSCIIGACNKEKIAGIIKLPANYQLELVIALGYPAQSSIVFDMDSSVKYYLDDNKTMHVPKRQLKDILHYNQY